MPDYLNNVRLDHFCMVSENPEALSRFYGRTLDMMVENRAGYSVAFGPERKVVFQKGKKGTIGFSAFAFPTKPELLAYRDELKSKNVEILPSPSFLFDDDAFCVKDTDGSEVVFGVPLMPYTFAEQSTRMKARLQHFVTTSTDIDSLTTFYRDVLRFRVADEVLDDDGKLCAIFLRTDEEHHSRAIFAAAEKRMDHHCYEAGEWNLIRDWGDRMGDENIPMAWGPGRHGPGHNLFFMIHDPDGNWIEISAELDVLPDNAPTGRWRHEPRTLNTWGQAFLRM